MAGRRLNGHISVAVERQILLGEDHSIDIVFIDGGKRPAVGEGIDRARSHREKDLVSLPDVDRGGGFGMNVRAVQHEVQLIRTFCIHDDHTVVQRTGEHIGAFVGDGDRAAGNLYGVGIAGGCIAVELNGRAFAFIVANLKIPVGKHVGKRCAAPGSIGIVHCIIAALTAAGQQHRKHQKQSQKPTLFHTKRLLSHSSVMTVSCLETVISRFPFRQRSLSMSSFSTSALRRVRL